MKKIAKQILSLLVVMTMTFSLSITAFAVDTSTYDITINDAIDGHTYGAYQLFSGNISNDVLVDIEWGSAVDDTLANDILTALKADTTIGTYFTNCTTAEDVSDVLALDTFTSYSENLVQFAEIVGNILADASISPTYTTSTYNNGTYSFEVSAGYYLILDEDSVENDASTFYILGVAQNLEVTPKTDVPTVEKKVYEDSELDEEDQLDFYVDYFNDASDWDIGQTQSFLIYANLPDIMWEYDTYEIQFNDSYDIGFTITTEAGVPLDAGTIDSANYKVFAYSGNTKTELNSNVFQATLTLPNDSATDTDGTITFVCEDIKSVLETAGIDSGDVKVCIEYYAELNTNAIIGITGNLNEVDLEYSNDPYNSDSKGKTEEDVVIVFTFEFEGTKVDGDEPTHTLKGAKFILSNGTGWAVIDENGYFQEWTTTEASATTLTTDSEGLFVVYGLDSGTYYLTETEAPEGYNLLTEDVELEITSVYSVDEDIYQQTWDSFVNTDTITSANLTIGDAEDSTAFTDTIEFTIENKAGSLLPSTGDTGRAIFYTLGALGFSAAAIILITRKRMARYKK